VKDLFVDIDSWLESGEEIAVATVVRTTGSTPRPKGASMALTRSGKITGSVSGGCLESAVFAEAMGVLDSRAPKLVHYGITDDMAWEVGLSCGGEIDVFIEPLA